MLSLNTLYFFDSNTAVDGCAAKTEPGYEQMEWLRIQLQFLRQRGMKAILMGHVPPARTESKQSWDETCWQKYTLWMRQYRDVVVGSIYGHMNIDHFILQDFEDINKKALRGDEQPFTRTVLDDDLTTQSSAEYLTELRAGWSRIPDPSRRRIKSKSGLGYFYELFDKITRRTKSKSKSKQEKFLEKIGGEWGERYSVSLVSPSVVPNYFPTLRVVEYNISGLGTALARTPNTELIRKTSCNGNQEKAKKDAESRRKRDHRHSKKPDFKVPKPPSKSSPPGPAYSPQTFSFLGYTQYYANLTRINNDFTNGNEDDLLAEERWHGGKHEGKRPKEKSKKHHKDFKYEVEYDTRNDSIFGLKDLTVRNYIDLAGRIGEYRPATGDSIESVALDDQRDVKDGTVSGLDRDEDVQTSPCGGHDLEVSKKKHKKHSKKHKYEKMTRKIWFTFVRRAYVGSKEEAELHEEF